jgi:hypothetical protein
MYHRGLIDLVRNSRSHTEERLLIFDATERWQLLSEERIRRHGWFWWLRPAKGE